MVGVVKTVRYLGPEKFIQEKWDYVDPLISLRQLFWFYYEFWEDWTIQIKFFTLQIILWCYFCITSSQETCQKELVVRQSSPEEMELVTQVQILEEVIYVSLSRKNSWERHESICCLSLYGLIVGQTWSLAFPRQPLQEKKNTKFKPVLSRLKIDFVSHSANLFLYLMAYQTSRVIKCLSHPCWRTAVILFNI